ncbi:MAG: DUF1573 domain-containing protein [Alistipes sp.]|nr:DUF1573 domain-containing protein [Alistipes sp.]
MLRKLATLGLLLTAMPVQAQWLQRISREQLDSLANPATAPGGEAMRFDARCIDTGEIAEDDAPSTYTFRWRNTGNDPLVVTRIETTCGCAKAGYEKRPVAAGGKGEVKITYHPKGHPGHFRRKIFVYTQLSEKQPTAILELKGHATPSVVPTHDYDHAMGPLLLKQRTLRLTGTQVQTERIECLNAGKEPLRLKADAKLLPEYLIFECDPQTFEPGKTGDLVIRFDPAKAPQKLPAWIPVMIEGLALPPSQRTLRIELGDRE